MTVTVTVTVISDGNGDGDGHGSDVHDGDNDNHSRCRRRLGEDEGDDASEDGVDVEDDDSHAEGPYGAVTNITDEQFKAGGASVPFAVANNRVLTKLT
jgi:hypothetical protein